MGSAFPLMSYSCATSPRVFAVGVIDGCIAANANPTVGSDPRCCRVATRDRACDGLVQAVSATLARWRRRRSRALRLVSRPAAVYVAAEAATTRARLLCGPAGCRCGGNDERQSCWALRVVSLRGNDGAESARADSASAGCYGSARTRNSKHRRGKLPVKATGGTKLWKCETNSSSHIQPTHTKTTKCTPHTALSAPPVTAT